MNSIDILKTFCKILGLYFIVILALNIRDIVFVTAGAMNMSDMRFAVVQQVYLAAFNGMIAYLLITKTDWISEKISHQKTGELKINIDKAGWIELAIISISVIGLLYSVSDFLYKLTTFLFFNEYDKGQKYLFWTRKNKSEIFYSVFQFIAALYFLLNARRLSERLIKSGHVNGEG